MTTLLERRPDLDAVFVASDVMALGRAGRAAPGRAAGCRRTSPSAGSTTRPPRVAARPALTTIRQPWQRISSEMVRLLLAAIGGEPPAAVILPTEFVRRESA